MSDRVTLGRKQSLGLLVLCLIVGTGVSLAASSPAISVEATVQGRGLAVECQATFDPADVQLGREAGYDTVSWPEATRLNEPGRPMLPELRLRVALPDGMAVTGVRVTAASGEDIPGSYLVFPGQTPRPTSTPGDDDGLLGPDAAAYAAATAYPESPVQYVRQSDLAGQSFAMIRVFPVYYLAASKRLGVYTSLSFVLDGEPGYVCGDYLPAASASASDGSVSARTASLHHLVKSMVVNPADVRLRTSEGAAAASRGVAAGDYDYVIVTQSSWVSNFQPLADWKTKKGVPATVVSLTWIYNSGGYSGSNQEKIRAFVADAHANWGTTFFLLGGDTNIVPYHTRSVSEPEPEDIPNDTYYADYDADWACEVHVGRAPVRSTAAITTFINKVLTYEKTPPLDGYATSAFFMGFDLNTAGSGEGEGCKININSTLLPTSWTYRREYDSESGTHKTDSIAALNLGNNLVNHIDHSSTTSMGVGYTNHNHSFSVSDMTNLTNGSRQGIWYSIGCWACDFPANTCIAEAWVQNANGGGLAFVGNSRYGWYVPFDPLGASNNYDRYFFRSIFALGNTHLGEAFSEHKTSAFGGDAYEQWIFTELTLLGDPELPIWTATPRTLTVTYPPSVYSGVPSSFPVQVRYNGNPVAGALVCAMKGTEVYQVGLTGGNGVATLNFTAATTGQLNVTVSGQNGLPHEGTAMVVSPSPGALTVNIAGQGSVGRSPDLATYPAYTVVQLQANPAAGWCFDHWEIGLSGSANPASITMYGDTTVLAVFEADCNGNGIRDDADIATAISWDCNSDGVPDECQIDDRHGLAGAYYDEMGMAGWPKSRVDSVVSFNWGEGAPRYDYGVDTFSVRWTGLVRTTSVGGSYVFYTYTDDGVRLWVNNQLLIDQWADQAPMEWSAAIELEANREYLLRMEYYENGGGAVAELRWQPPGQAKAVIPTEYLRPGRDCNSNGVVDDCDFATSFAATSPNLTPLGAGYPQTYTLSQPPDAAAAVQMSFAAMGDLNYGSEYVDVLLNGTWVGSVYAGFYNDCMPEELDALSVTASTFNAVKAGGNVAIQLIPSDGVDPMQCQPSSTYIRVSVSYTALTNSHDDDGNGIPDECDAPPICRADCNCDGSVGFADIDFFVASIPNNQAAWTAKFAPGSPTCPFANCDVNGNGNVGFDDIDPFVSLIPSACP